MLQISGVTLADEPSDPPADPPIVLSELPTEDDNIDITEGDDTDGDDTEGDVTDEDDMDGADLDAPMMLMGASSTVDGGVVADVINADYTFDVVTGTLTILTDDAIVDEDTGDELTYISKWHEEQTDGDNVGKCIYPSMVKAVVIADSVTTIPALAFYSPPADTEDEKYDAKTRFSNLASVTFEGTSQVTSIGFRAFQSTTALENIIIPDSVHTIAGAAFMFSGLTAVTIPATVTAVGDYAFSDCKSLISATVGMSDFVERVVDGGTITVQGNGFSMFSDCAALETVNFTNPALTIIPNLMFDTCKSLETVTFADGTKLEVIAGMAFSGCDSLAYFTLPDGGAALKKIGDLAFIGSGLTVFPVTAASNALTTIGGYAFSECKFITLDLTYCTALESIGKEAFSECPNLISVTLPASKLNGDGGAYVPAQLYIRYGAFASNPLLTGEVKLPYNVAIEVGEVFLGNGSISGFAFHGDHLAAHGVQSESTKNTSGCMYLPDAAAGTWSLGKNLAICNGRLYTLSGTLVESLKDDVIDDVLYIAEDTKIIASGQYRGDTRFSSVVIPATVQIIDNNAFEGCTNLTTVTIEDGSHLFFVGEKAFAGTAITEFAFATPAADVIYNYTAIGPDAFTDTPISKLTIPANLILAGTLGKVVSTPSITGWPAPITPDVPLANGTMYTSGATPPDYTAGSRAGLYKCVGLKEIEVIQDRAYNNPYLISADGVLFGTSVTLNDGDSVLGYDMITSRGEGYLIQFPPAKTFGGIYDIYAVAKTLNPPDYWPALSDVNFTYDLTIGAYAFYNAQCLTSVIIPATTTSIAEYAFGADDYTSLRFIDFAKPQESNLGTPYYSSISPPYSVPVFFHGALGNAPLALFMPDNVGTDLISDDITAHMFYDAVLSNDGDTLVTITGSGAEGTHNINDRLKLSVYRGKSTHTWAVQNELTVYYRAKTSALEAYPPDDIYQYIPYRFVPETSLLDNSGLMFHITGDSLPNGFRLVTGDATKDADIPAELLKELIPGTIYGTLYENAATIATYGTNGRIRFTLYATNGAGFSGQATYDIQLVPAPTAADEKFDVWPLDGTNIDKKPDGSAGDPVTQRGFFDVTDIAAPKFKAFATTAELTLTETTRTSIMNKSYKLFRGVYLNGRKLVEGTDYTSHRGSTVVTLTDQTIAGLPTGEYTLAVAFLRTDFTTADYGTEANNDLEVITTNFTIAENSAPLADLPGYIENPDGTPSTNPDVPGPGPGPVGPSGPSDSGYPSIPASGSGAPVPDAPSTDMGTPAGGDGDSSAAPAPPSGDNAPPSDDDTPPSDDDTPPVVGDASTTTVTGGGAAPAVDDDDAELPRVGLEALIDLLPTDEYGNVIVDGDLSLHIDIPFAQYTGATTLNAVPLVHSATEGSTIIYIPYSSFDAFAAGIHTLEVAFDEVILTLSIRILERLIADNAEPEVPQTVAPVVVPLPIASDAPTDNSMTLIIIISAVLALGVIGLAAVMLKRRIAAAKH